MRDLDKHRILKCLALFWGSLRVVALKSTASELAEIGNVPGNWAPAADLSAARATHQPPKMHLNSGESAHSSS